MPQTNPRKRSRVEKTVNSGTTDRPTKPQSPYKKAGLVAIRSNRKALESLKNM